MVVVANGCEKCIFAWELDREIYMNKLMGFQSKKYHDYVSKVGKALYGLQKAPRTRYGKMNFLLIVVIECHLQI